ncbi:MAG: hypothetical protein ACLRVT_02155 [Oscillospiraceae bacterium]
MRRRAYGRGPRAEKAYGVVHVRWQIVLCVAALIAGMVVLDSAVRPALTTLATYQARYMPPRLSTGPSRRNWRNWE